MNDTLPPETMTFAQARADFRADFTRWVEWLGGGSLPQRVYWFFLPAIQALFWYRVSRWLFLNGWRNTARLVGLFSLYLTRIELPRPVPSVPDASSPTPMG